MGRDGDGDGEPVEFDLHIVEVPGTIFKLALMHISTCIYRSQIPIKPMTRGSGGRHVPRIEVGRAPGRCVPGGGGGVGVLGFGFGGLWGLGFRGLSVQRLRVQI